MGMRIGTLAGLAFSEVSNWQQGGWLSRGTMTAEAAGSSSLDAAPTRILPRGGGSRHRLAFAHLDEHSCLLVNYSSFAFAHGIQDIILSWFSVLEI